MTLEQRIQQALETRFPGSDASGVQVQGTGRIGGLFLYNGFEGMDHPERQTVLWDFLRETFEAEAPQIGLIFTYTPGERELILSA